MNGLLKFITCGSVDDGKSTLIGHILYDAKLLYADQEKALLLDSKVGSRGGAIDYSLLLDGLMAEREQGITIDVAYRYFTTDRRSFIVADTPGHEEYTRNMAVGASFAQLSIILVDATQGVLVQTRRHARICALMGIRHFVFAVNKMDLVSYSKERFEEIRRDILKLAEQLSLEDVKIIPVSATEGDNVTVASPHMPWYQGGTLLEHLETVDVSETAQEQEFYMPVQRVCRPNHTFRGFQGQIESGRIRVGDSVISLPSREKATVKSLLVSGNEKEEAEAGQAVTIQLDREVDVSRGCVLTNIENLPVGRTIKTTLLWMDDEKLVIGKEYLVKIGTKRTSGVLTGIDYNIDVNTGKHLDAAEISKNEIAVCTLKLTDNVVADAFVKHKTLGELILIDRVSHMTCACGVVEQVTDEKKSLFEKGNLRSDGHIFDELYYDLERGAFSWRESSAAYTEGDTVPVQGESFTYPKDFDILSVYGKTAVIIRDSRVEAMIPLDDYSPLEFPVVDENGFSLTVQGADRIRTFLQEALEKEQTKEQIAALYSKWFQFGTYRTMGWH